jgi:hypothetical protein
VNAAHWYRKCPTCRGQFGRGKGKNGLARHACDDPSFDEIRALKKKLDDREARLASACFSVKRASALFNADDQFDAAHDALHDVRRACSLTLRNWRPPFRRKAP